MNPEKSFIINPGFGLILTDLLIDHGALLRAAQLPGDLFARGAAALTPEDYFRLWDTIGALAPETPIRLAGVLSMEVFDPPIFAAVCSPDLNTTARRIAEYKRLIGPMALSVAEGAGRTSLRYDWPPGMRPPAVLQLSELVFWVALTRMATRRDVVPLAVTMPDPPEEMEDYRSYFGVAVRKGPHQMLAFSASDAALPFVTANEGLWDFFEPQLRRRLAEMDRGASMGQRVRAALLELLPGGHPTMGSVARALAVSTRTLQRRLRQEGITFQVVLGETREALARHYLTQSSMTTAEISFLLGYEEPNSFYRAFRSWTGETPAAIRAANR